MTEEQFINEAMELIKAELNNKKHFSTKVLFGDELGASDWTPEDAVKALFRYASAWGWGYDDTTETKIGEEMLDDY